MNLLELPLPDLIGTMLGFLFTLFVFSYLFGDNALFRLAIHLFIGVAAGYTVVVAWYSVIWPQLLIPLLVGGNNERLFLLAPLVLSLLLLAKAFPRLAFLGTPVMGYLVGVGAATAIGGAILGTLFPQVSASASSLDLQAISTGGGNFWMGIGNGLILLAGTLATLLSFQFSTRPGDSRPGGVEAIARIGGIFIAITLGALFAGIYSASLTALIERVYFLGRVLLPFLSSQ